MRSLVVVALSSLLVPAAGLSAQAPAAASPAAPAAPVASGAASGEKIYVIDTNHSTIGFAVPILGMSEVTGKFADFTGRIVVPDETDLTKATVQVVIKTASIDTGIADRDKHLRTADFFDATNYPEITFKSQEIRRVGDGYAVIGDFTMRGVTKRLTIPFQLTGHDKVLGAKATLPLNRRDYGVSWSRVMDNGAQFVADVVTVELRVLTRVGMTAAELAKAEAARKPGAKD
jgi:polyisoprenoid-binding protein YceI